MILRATNHSIIRENTITLCWIFLIITCNKRVSGWRSLVYRARLLSYLPRIEWTRLEWSKPQTSSLACQRRFKSSTRRHLVCRSGLELILACHVRDTGSNPVQTANIVPWCKVVKHGGLWCNIRLWRFKRRHPLTSVQLWAGLPICRCSVTGNMFGCWPIDWWFESTHLRQ